MEFDPCLGYHSWDAADREGKRITRMPDPNYDDVLVVCQACDTPMIIELLIDFGEQRFSWMLECGSCESRWSGRRISTLLAVDGLTHFRVDVSPTVEKLKLLEAELEVQRG